jgi:transposase-like protein
MTRSKLSESDKREIAELFSQEQETIASLAERFQVSVSTIRRLVKTAPLAEESEVIASVSTADVPIQATTRATDGEVSVDAENAPPRKRILPRKRSELAREHDLTASSLGSSSPYDALERNAAPLGEILAEIGQDLQADLSTRGTLDEDDEDDDLQGFEDDFDDADDDLDEGDDALADVREVLQVGAAIEVVSIHEALLPRTCYVVIDRMAELVTRPLKDFGDLGQIPGAEVQANTLPVFDNHRIARRFSHRAQRIVKVPNGNLFKKTNSHLVAKGITRLLVNGRIYAL